MLYASQFFPVSLGLESPFNFCKKKVCLFEDYQKLHQILPKGSALFVPGKMPYGIISAVYSPRDIFLSSRDFLTKEKIKEIFMLWLGPGEPPIVQDYRVDRLMYDNAEAKVVICRTPGRPNELARMRVFSLRSLSGN